MMIASRVCRLLLGLALAVLLGFAGLGSAQTVPMFLSTRTLSVGTNPTLPAVGDFNTDGKLDLAVANSNGGSVSVLLGNGDGTFRDRADLPSPGPVAVAVGDLDRDGNVDLAVAQGDANGSIGVFFGNGDGTFQPAVGVPLGAMPIRAMMADVNGDGALDIVVTTADSVFVLLSDGTRNFSGATQVSTCACAGRLDFVAAADFDGDGRQDLAVNGSLAVFILLGNGDGTFREGPTVGSNPGPMAVGDFNGDGKPDLVVAYRPAGVSNPGFVTLYLGNGDGTFNAKSASGGIKGLGNPVVADFNGDGKLDFAVKGASEQSVNIMLGNGDGTAQPAISLHTEFLANLLVAGDFDGNGAADLLESNFGDNSLSLLLNTSGQPPLLGLLSLSPATGVGGATVVQGTVFLGGPAPGGGLTISLASSNTGVAKLPVDASVTVPAGSTSASFSIETAPVPAPATADIIANLNGVTQVATLSLVPQASGLPGPAVLSIKPASLFGANTASGTFTLPGPAAYDTPVALSSSAAAIASVPASITVPAGGTAATFSLNVQPVATDTNVTISAAAGGNTATAVLTVLKPLDAVVVSRAEFDARNNELRVEATSTNASATLSVVVTSSGQLLFVLENLGNGRYSGRFFVTENPVNITVKSSLGGVRSVPLI